MDDVLDLDRNRLKISNLVFKKSYKKKEKFREKYQANDDDDKERCAPANPMKYESVVETMRRRKFEQECQRKTK